MLLLLLTKNLSLLRAPILEGNVFIRFYFIVSFYRLVSSQIESGNFYNILFEAYNCLRLRKFPIDLGITLILFS